jgi:hypothetical protein
VNIVEHSGATRASLSRSCAMAGIAAPPEHRRQFQNMHATDGMRLGLDDSRAVRRHDVAQRRQWRVRGVPGDQAVETQLAAPVKSVACHGQYGETGPRDDIAEGD